MSDHKECCTPAPPAEHGSLGKEERCCGLDVYFNWPAGATKAVVFASDVFGWNTPLLRKFADKVAAAGFVAVIPDLFKGDPYDPTKVTDGTTSWLARHPFEPASEDTLAVVKGLKDKGIISVGVAGFCYGGKVGVLVAKEGVLDATVILHPSLVTVEDVKMVKGPLAVLAAEIDHVTPVTLVEEYKKCLETHTEVEHFVKIYLGVAHGWTVRYDETDLRAVKLAEEAHSDAIDFFKKHLK